MRNFVSKQRPLRAFSGLLAVITLLIASHTGADAADETALRREHRGVALRAQNPAAEKSFDTTLLSAEAGLTKLAAALDRLIEKSPRSVRELSRLQRSGRVTLLYKPTDLRNTLGDETVALFLPDYIRASARPGRQKVYLVAVGRHGIKWPVDELAATLAHELLGHGRQHRRNRLMGIRRIDAECEANLYEEIANQDLGLDKFSHRMIAFRQAMEYRWCADFKAYMRAERPREMVLWDQLNPDVTRLLATFKAYLDHSMRAGVTARAVNALKRQTRNSRRRALQSATPETLFLTAKRLRDGGLGIQPDADEALRYFRLAAEGGYPRARNEISDIQPAGSSIEGPLVLQAPQRDATITR